jgi:hypothetical protein
MPLEKGGAALNRLRELWRKGTTTLGATVTIPSVQTMQVMARSGCESPPTSCGIHPPPLEFFTDDQLCKRLGHRPHLYLDDA